MIFLPVTFKSEVPTHIRTNSKEIILRELTRDHALSPSIGMGQVEFCNELE